MKIKKIQVQEKHKPALCLLGQILMFIGLVFFCFGVAIVAKDYGLRHLFSEEKYMEAVGGCVIVSSLLIITNAYAMYKITYGWSEEDMEGAHLKSVRFGHFDKETLLKNKENILDFKRKQIKKEEEMGSKEAQLSKKVKEISELKKNEIEKKPNKKVEVVKNGIKKQVETIDKIFER